MKKLLIAVVSFVFAFAATAQSADFVTKVLESEQATYGQVCYLCAVCNNLVGENATETEAMKALVENQKLNFGDVKFDDVINYKNTSVVFSKIWNIKGGLFYRMTKGSPRYAFKQFKTDGVIKASVDPDMIPSGVDVLNIYTAGTRKYDTVFAGE